MNVTEAADNNILNRIQIAAPCSLKWEGMPGGERVRSCAQCNHKVYNLSEMSASEAADLIRNAEGRVCVRLYRRADGSVMTSDCPTGLRAARQKVVRAAGVAFASVLSVFGIFSYASRARHVEAEEPRMGDVVVAPTPVGTPAPTPSEIPIPNVGPTMGAVAVMPEATMGKVAIRTVTPLPMAPTPDPSKKFLPTDTPAITREDPFSPLPKQAGEKTSHFAKAGRS